MNLSLYSAASGMEAQQINLNTISNNIANVNTSGYKRSKVEFQDLLYQSPRQAGGEAGAGNIVPTSVEMGNGVRVTSTSKLFTQGQLTETGQELDVAIEGNGFLQVTHPDGNTVYTRDGALKLSPTGEIVTAEGMPLTGVGTIPTDAVSIYISDNGNLAYMLSDGSTTQLAQVQLARFPNSGGLKSLGGNLFQETTASGTAEIGNPDEDGYGSLKQGYLEMSNVNVVQEMVNMIIAQRAYEINSKAIQTSDSMLGQVSSLKR